MGKQKFTGRFLQRNAIGVHNPPWAAALLIGALIGVFISLWKLPPETKLSGEVIAGAIGAAIASAAMWGIAVATIWVIECFIYRHRGKKP